MNILMTCASGGIIINDIIALKNKFNNLKYMELIKIQIKDYLNIVISFLKFQKETIKIIFLKF